MIEGPREEVYDEQISPLMQKIIEICKREKIPMIASFELDDAGHEDGPLYCSTCLLTDDMEVKGERLHRMERALNSTPGGFMALTVVTGGKTCEEDPNIPPSAS